MSKGVYMIYYRILKPIGRKMAGPYVCSFRAVNFIAATDQCRMQFGDSYAEHILVEKIYEMGEDRRCHSFA